MTVNGSGTDQEAGEDYTLTCVVSGGTITVTTYRWRRNGGLLSGGTSATLSFIPLRQTSPSSNGQYTCEATRGRRTVESEDFKIFVTSKSD